MAAKSLHITPTAVSKQIKSFENQLNNQLLIRTTRHVELTEFGQLIFDRCKHVVDQLIAINQFADAKNITPQGKLKVLVSTILAKSFFLKHITGFIKCYPQIRAEVFFSENDSDLGRKDIDVMLGFPQIPPLTDFLN